MAELVKFVHHGASRITMQVINGVYKKLPVLKVEFAQINAPKYPHLVDQLEFLSDVVEDFAENQADDLPLCAVAAAAFALIYAHRQFDLIPDQTPEIGHSDDSAVVRVVLIENEKTFAKYAEKLGRDWQQITVEA